MLDFDLSFNFSKYKKIINDIGKNKPITRVEVAIAANKENTQSNNKGPLNFGTHPSGPNKPSIDIKKQLSMLEKEKAMFLKTKVYNKYFDKNFTNFEKNCDHKRGYSISS